MAIADILRALDDQAEADCKKIVEQAHAEAEAIKRDATEQAEAAKTARLERAHGQVEPRVGQLINSTRLQNKREIDAVRAEAIEAVFTDAASKLGVLRSESKEYPTLLEALLREALAGNEGSAEAIVDQADMALLAPVVATTTCTLTASATPQGGVTVMTCDGKVARRNTLADRLEAVRRSSASDVAEILFG
jgi:vacuolar-type H+-ATPase subunit E/Vma4